MKAYFASLLPGSEHRAKTPEGYLICKNTPIARTGWQTYRAAEVGAGGDELVEVYRSPEEVFSDATMASFEGKSIASPHPPVFLTPENDAGYNKGHVQNFRKVPKLDDGEQCLIADLIIKDKQLIMQIENGSVAEVSCGYECMYEPYGDGR